MLQNLLPADGYIIKCLEPFHHEYEKSLTHLYQPLIGIEAVSLFQTLVHEYDLYKGEKIQTHHTLMSYLQISLDTIYKAKQKLEAIGLLKTFEQKENDYRLFTYVLKSPFSPKYFFEDVMLQQLLYHHVGKEKFLSLKQIFNTSKINIKGEEVTASFNDVFETFTPGYQPEIEENVTFTYDSLQIDLKSIDLQSLASSLKRRMIQPETVLTRKNIKIIQQIATLYNLETYEIENALQWALDDRQVFQQSSFINACEDIYVQKTGTNHVHLQMKEELQQINKKKQQESTIKSKENRLLEKFETMSPKEILEDFSKGNIASRYELKMISEVMTEQGLPIPVMNVLIHYILLQTGNELSRPYLETIASNWSRANLTTAKEAMDYARNWQERVAKKKQKKVSSYRQSKRHEVIPKWLQLQRKQKKNESNTHQENIEKLDPLIEQREKEQIAAALQQFTSKKN